MLRSRVVRYGWALILVAFGVGARELLWHSQPGYAFVAFYIPITISAAWLGFGPALLTCGVSALLAWYVWLPPGHSFAIDGPTALALGLFVLSGAIICHVVSPLQRPRRDDVILLPPASAQKK